MVSMNLYGNLALYGKPQRVGIEPSARLVPLQVAEIAVSSSFLALYETVEGV